MPLPLIECLLASLVVALSAMVQGVIGFGVGVLGVPLLYLIDPDFVPAPMIIIGMALPVLIIWRDGHAVVKRDIASALPGLAFGVVLAGWVLSFVTEKELSLFLAGVVIFGVLLSLLGRFPPPTMLTVSLAAALSGFMGTITAIGGPPLSLVFQGIDGPRLRGTLSSIFLPAGAMALCALFVTERLSPRDLVLAMVLAPGMCVGYWCSSYANRFMPARFLRPGVLLISTVAAGLILARTLSY